MAKEKVRRVRLKIAQRIEIASKVKNGVNRRQIAAEYGIHYASICRIVKEAPNLAGSVGDLNRKSRKPPAHPELDDKLKNWIEQQTSKGIYVLSMEVRLKAKAIASELKIEKFNSSNEYLERFVKRNNIGIVKFDGEACGVKRLWKLGQKKKFETDPNFSVQLNKINVLQAMHPIFKAWNNVKSEKITHCFKKAHFHHLIDQSIEEDDDRSVDHQDRRLDERTCQI